MPTHILVVEHNPDLQLLIPRLFRDAIESGEILFTYTTKASEALQYLAHSSKVSAAVLAEVNPLLVEGQTLFSEVSEQYPLVPIIPILPDDKIYTIKAAMNQGAFDFLIKPVDENDLQNSIYRVIRYTQQLHLHASTFTQMENQLNQLKQAIETMCLGMTITDVKGKILYTNPADARMHGYEVDELLGQDVHIFAPPELRHPMTLEQIRQWKGSIRESINIRRDGSRFPVGLISDIIKDAKGQPIAIVTSCENISERKHVEAELKKHREDLEELINERTTELLELNKELQQEIIERQHAEEALRESEEQYRLLFENLPDVFYRIDREGNLILTSPSIALFLGYSAKEALGLNFGRDVFVHPEQWQDFLMFMEADGHLENFEVLLKRKDGSFEWGSANAQLYTDHDGHVLGFEGIIRDVSVRKQAEIELIVAHDELQKTNMQLQELNASKDKFFSIISHDLRSQFATLLGFTELLEIKVETFSPQRLKELIGKLKDSAERLYALFENLLTWSRIQRGVIKSEQKMISLFAIAEENMIMMQPKAELKQIELRNLVPKAIRAYADHSMVDTIIRNLLSNALKFTDAGGSITISAEFQDQDVEVVIADTGCGIDKAARDLLFRIDTTYTTTGTAGEHGTGLGLILCKELVEKNAGNIWAESEVGKGTTFIFTIPRFPLANNDHF